MTIHVYNNPDKALLQDDEGLNGVILSLACLQSLLHPHQTISSLIAESKKRTRILFVLSQIHKLRNELNLPRRHLDDSIASLEWYANEMYYQYCNYRETIRPALIPDRADTIPAILASLEQMRADLGPINWSQVTSTEFAIIIGVCVGVMKSYPYPRIASTRMANIGTGVVHEMFTHLPPIPVPSFSWVYPQQPAQPRATQPKPDLGSDSDVEDAFDIQSDSQGEPDADASPRCVRATVSPACSPVGGFFPPASTVLASQSNILQQMQCRKEDISNNISEVHINEEDSEALNHDVSDAEM
jgi:hypothetical protein